MPRVSPSYSKPAKAIAEAALRPVACVPAPAPYSEPPQSGLHAPLGPIATGDIRTNTLTMLCQRLMMWVQMRAMP